jgi:transcription initiation factor IIE alpha subunit
LHLIAHKICIAATKNTNKGKRATDRKIRMGNNSTLPMKYSGIRILLIYNLKRDQLIDFVKRKDKNNDYSLASFAWHTDEQLRQIAISVDKKMHTEKQKNKRIIKNKKVTTIQQ